MINQVADPLGANHWERSEASEVSNGESEGTDDNTESDGTVTKIIEISHKG